MPRRIDIDGGDPQNDIEEALRQLTQRDRGRTAEREAELERAIHDVGEQQAVQIPRRRPVASPWPARIAWIGIAVVVIALIVAAVVLTRPEPLPPPAGTAEAAVRGFWTALIDGHYESAITYYPYLETPYGSRKQAAEHLRDLFRTNPPVTLRNVGVPEQLPESSNYSVAYEVIKRNGMPTNGTFVVLDTGKPETGYVIVSGGV